jgi:hypothetical protein
MPDKDEYYEYDIARLKGLLSNLKKDKELDNFTKLEIFFDLILTPYYFPESCSNGDITANAGHIIYRISDSIPLEIRERIKVYSNDSLEDWRKEWASGGAVIPNFRKKLPDLSRLLDDKTV